jgi:hypothetical protein
MTFMSRTAKRGSFVARATSVLARTVVDIYRRYLALKSVRDLHNVLAGAGIRSKRRIRADGTTYAARLGAPDEIAAGAV